MLLIRRPILAPVACHLMVGSKERWEGAAILAMSGWSQLPRVAV
jgi:hypothetical protein